MSKRYSDLDRASRGAWVIHHARKTAGAVAGAAEFPALDTAGKAASLLSQLAGSDELSFSPEKVNALARAAGLNTKLEVPDLISILKDRSIIDQVKSGAIVVLGLTTHATVGHAADLFDDQEPSAEERAAVLLSDTVSSGPKLAKYLAEEIGDEFKLSKKRSVDFVDRARTIGFVDGESAGDDQLLFNGNLFRRDGVAKAKAVLDSLKPQESRLLAEVNATLDSRGCLRADDVEKKLGTPLFEKLRAASLYDVHHVSNPSGEFGYVTRPSAFHKFNDPLADDAFDLAKALVAALTYGMKDSSAGRGKIDAISLLLGKLVRGYEVGPATAIGEDYRILETKGVISTRPGERYGRYMKLLKRDIGEMAFSVLTLGNAATTNVIDRALPGSMTGYVTPEESRKRLRQKQTPASKVLTFDVLEAVREGNF